jgi:hypothetical protein
MRISLLSSDTPDLHTAHTTCMRHESSSQPRETWLGGGHGTHRSEDTLRSRGHRAKTRGKEGGREEEHVHTRKRHLVDVDAVLGEGGLADARLVCGYARGSRVRVKCLLRGQGLGVRG